MHRLVALESLEDLYENAPCGYLSFLDDGTIVRINATLLKWLGTTREEVVSCKRFQDFLSVGERIFFETHFAPLLQMQKSVEEINFSLVSVNKIRIPVLTATKKFDSAETDVKLNRMTLFNITDRKKYETELILERARAEEALRSKAAFLSMLSHEIRTPLNAVVSVANLMDATALDSQQRDFVAMLKGSSENLMNLLNSILDLSKIESGQVTLEAKPFSLRKLCENVVLGQKSRALEKEIGFGFEISDELPEWFIGDAVKLGQILSNLLGNAIKFTTTGKVLLKVKGRDVSPSRAILCFEVIDTGIGIAPEHLSRIFEEYKQAESETASRFGGTGLGLAISSRLVAMHHSKLSVESIVGQGSTFSFEVALEVSESGPKAKDEVFLKQNAESLRGLRVLVVDDSEDNLFLICHFLKNWNVAFQSATNGLDALAQVRMNTFDLVLMDLQMPVMTGYQAVAAIRTMEDSAKQKLPVIAFSASTKFAGRDASEILAFDEIVGKPFSSGRTFFEDAKGLCEILISFEVFDIGYCGIYLVPRRGDSHITLYRKRKV